MNNSDLHKKVFAELFEEAPVNITVIDHDYNIIMANKNFEQKFGDWQGKKCYSAYKNRKNNCKICMTALTFEDGLHHVDDELGTDITGKQARYVVHTAPIRNNDGKIEYVIKMSSDVTEMRQLQNNYNVLFERAPCFVAIMDRDFRIVRTNEKFRSVYGDHVGEKCYKVYKKRNIKCENCPAEKTFKDGMEHRAEQTGITKEGERNHYIVNTAPLGKTGEKFAHVIEISTDVTQLRSMQNEIAHLYDFQQALIKNSLHAIIGTNENNEIIIYNPSAEKLFNIPSDSVLGTSDLKNFLPPEFLNVLKTKGETCVLPETTLPLPDRDSVPVRFSGVVLRENDTVLGSAAFFHDLTQIKKLEEEKLENERMAAVGHTVAGLAHGVKNILSGIQGGMYIMRTGLKSGEAERILNGWDMLERNIDKISVFVKDFLSFSKGEKPVVELTDVVKIHKDVVLLYKDAAQQAGIEIIDNIQEDIAEAYFDPDGLHACIANLVSNAIDACQLSDRENNTIEVRLFEKDGMITTEVEDNGAGMDCEIKKKVFTNFFTTKGTKGTGIGLLTTRKIVNQHGGTITFDSQKGKGSVFRISFSRENLNNKKSEV